MRKLNLRDVCLLSGPLCLVLVMAWMALSSSSKTVVFNQSKLTKQFVTQLSHHAMKDEALRQKTDAYAAALRVSLKAYAKKNHVLVLDASHVLSGGEDVTDAIGAMVARQMRGQS